VLVIDINYFPSYKEVPDFPARLRRYLVSRKGAGADRHNSQPLDSGCSRAQNGIAAHVGCS
jgi:hypothetical protein